MTAEKALMQRTADQRSVWLVPAALLVAIEAADVALMQDHISRLVYLKKLARTTVNTIRFNITVSMCINAVAVTLSVLRILNPVTGALVHNAGSALVVLNAALLYDRKFE